MMEACHPFRMWWLSFADATLPEGSQFLGVAVVRAADLETAVLRAHALGINPGGEVYAVPFPPSLVDLVPEQYVEKLLNKQGIETLDEWLAKADEDVPPSP